MPSTLRVLQDPHQAERQYHDAIAQRRRQAGMLRDKALARYQQAEQLFAAVRQEAEHGLGPTPAGAGPPARIGQPEPARPEPPAPAFVGQLLRRHSAVLADLLKLEAAYLAAEDRYAALTAEMSAYEDWAARTVALTEQLHREYQGHGPQYEILIRRLVQAEIHAEQLEAQGAGHTPEHDRTVRGVLLLVQALQKYTEDTGSLRQEIRDGILAALQEIEPELAAAAPQAWRDAMRRLRARITGEVA